MQITEQINHIIDRRIGRNDYEGKGHLEVIKRQKTFFEGVSRLVDDYSTLRATILTQIKEQKGEYYVMSMEDPLFLEKVEQADPSSFILQLQKCLKECDRLTKRFNRDTINISVVGRAGQGKSRLLQSISGVPNDIIPADTGGDCTGAKSVIANAQGSMHAVINFYTEQEIVTQVQAYLNALGADITINNISQVPRINLNEIKGKLGRMTSTQDSLFRHLTDYVNHYDVYSPNLGTTKDESDPKMIRYYVAQYATGNNKERYYAYLGVKEVTIFTEFPEVDAGKIMLVDTIGLGDTSLNLEDKMMETLENDSDAAIVVRKADPEREHISNEDNNFYDYLVRSFGNRDVEKWLFYALNVCEALHNTVTGEELYEKFKEKRDEGSLRVALLEKVDCGSPKEVREKLLLPMLEFIAQNLEEIDKNLMNTANDQFTSAYASYFELCNKVRNVLKSAFSELTNTGGLFDKKYKELLLSNRLKELDNKYKNISGTSCTQLLTEIEEVRGNLPRLVPTKDQISSIIAQGNLYSDYTTVYNQCAHLLRSRISDEFERVTNNTMIELQENLKDEIIQVLREEKSGKLGLIPLMTVGTDSPNKVWLEAFISEKMDGYPLVKQAFQYILDYRINIEGAIENKISHCLAIFDPNSQQSLGIEWNRITDDKAAAKFIQQHFYNSVSIFSNSLIESLSELLTIPYISFTTRIRKFRDKIIFSEDGEAELKNLYRDHCGIIWREDFSNQLKKQNANNEWNTYCEKLSFNCQKEKFTC